MIEKDILYVRGKSNCDSYKFKIGDIVEVLKNESLGHKEGSVGVLVSGENFLKPREFGVLFEGIIRDHTFSGFKLIKSFEK